MFIPLRKPAFTCLKRPIWIQGFWSFKKDEKAISLADGFEGTLDDNGGKIRFQTVGSYELTATVTDNTGCSFTYTFHRYGLSCYHCAHGADKGNPYRPHGKGFCNAGKCRSTAGFLENEQKQYSYHC